MERTRGLRAKRSELRLFCSSEASISISRIESFLGSSFFIFRIILVQLVTKIANSELLELLDLSELSELLELSEFSALFVHLIRGFTLLF